MPRFVVAGTDTDIGKTVFAAALTRAIDAHYWKPVQAGLDGSTDSERVRNLGVPQDRILDEAYRLKTPCSPHQAAQIDGVEIARERLSVAPDHNPLIIEGAGGVLVPLTQNLLYADVFADWGLPVILVASTRLGTINHSLLSIEALQRRQIQVHGIAFIGDAMKETEAVIARMGEVRRLGRLPLLSKLDTANLESAFTDNFDLGDFR